MKTVIVKYNAGNIQSVLYALNRIGVVAEVTDNPDTILSADKVIFPGVGEASTAMQYLKERQLDRLIQQLTQPVLGICLGMQLMCKFSEENNTNCLGIFDVTVKKFSPSISSQIKVPQVGWNSISALRTPLFKAVPENAYVYFVHSYYATLSNYTIGEATYIQPYSVALNKANFYGVQFHPEKSAVMGELIMKNFIEL